MVRILQYLAALLLGLTESFLAVILHIFWGCVTRVLMKKNTLRNRKGEEVAAIFVDEKSSRWRIVSKTEPGFKRTFPTEKEAFDVWHAMFNAQTGKLLK